MSTVHDLIRGRMMTLKAELMERIARAREAGQGIKLTPFELKMLFPEPISRPRPWLLRLFDRPANWIARRRYERNLQR